MLGFYTVVFYFLANCFLIFDKAETEMIIC